MKNRKLVESQTENKKTVNKLPLWLQRINIYLLVVAPILISLFLLSGFLFVGEKIYGKNIPEFYYAITGAVCIIVGSLSGMFQVIRKEGPGPFGNPVYGVWPVISGIILIIICWISAAILILYVIF